MLYAEEFFIYQNMKKAYKKCAKKVNKALNRTWPLFMLIFSISLIFPHLTFAHSVELNPQLPYLAGKIEVLKSYPTPPRLPKIEVKQPRQTINIWVTAYNSLPGQTDSTPCITASGMDVCERNTEDIIATNFNYLPFGTKIRLPELFGDKIFIVEDRMNKRYWQTADIWLKNYKEARNFGRKYTVMEIL